MHIVDFLLGRPKPTRVAAVYASRENALAAAEAAKSEAAADDDDVRVVGPLEQVIGSEPATSQRGAWAVIVQPETYEQGKRVVRALRRPFRRRQLDRARTAVAPQSESPAEAGLVADRR